MLPQHQYLLLMDQEKLGEGPLSHKQVWISRMEAEILAEEKVNVIELGGSKQMELEERGRVDGESRVSEEH